VGFKTAKFEQVTWSWRRRFSICVFV